MPKQEILTMPHACRELKTINWLHRLVAVLLAFGAAVAFAQTPPHFAVVGDHFELDGKPYLIRSGEMHYARIPREYWRDRLRYARAMGLNTIQTYVFWNLHEPEPGHFDFSGDLDIAAFVRMAQEEGLNVIVRPGPYICTEWEFGGFPAWLLRTPGLRVRSFDSRFLAASARYLKRVGEELKPLMSTRGGPILMAQVENEYGSFGDDHEYMQAIRQQMLDAGFDLPLFTSDGPDRHLLEGGTLPGVPAALNFDGSAKDAQAAFDTLAALRPNAPRIVGEYWAGWFDHWGEKHHTTDAKAEAATVDWFLAHGVSFNLYMFHGGTSFGYMAGANYSAKEPYQPDTTSYDYDAPLDESGRPTPKYFALRETIRRHLPPGETLPDVPAVVPTIAIPRFELNESAGLFANLDALGKSVRADLPRSMEELGQNYGFVLYRKTLDQPAKGELSVGEARDYAQVFVDGKQVGKLDRRLGESKLPIASAKPATLDLLVENLGRINFAPKLVDEHKGITHSVRLGDKELLDWEMWSLPLGSEVTKLPFAAGKPVAGPVFRRGEFDLAQTGDTFLDLRGWGRGHVWVNGHHLGRFWSIGPQQTLYLPAPWLHPGRNEVIVLDLDGGAMRSVAGLGAPVFQTVVKP
jgi:beta-galactosidase